MMRLNSQVENLIKISKPYSKVKPISKNLIFKDRFGNEYLPNELPKILKQQPTSGVNTPSANGLTIIHSCTIGHFNIQFVQDDVNYGFDSLQYRNVICEVFKDLDRLLYKQNSFPPYVLVIITSDSTLSTAVTGASLPPGVDIMGTSFEPVKYKQSNNWQDNMMYRSIKWGYSGYERMMGSNGFHPFYNYAHGLLTVNFKNKTWYKNFKDTLGIPSNQDDLYTHTLHQVMHMLGINASINELGNTTIGNSLYARYTNFLYKNNSSNKLFTYSKITKKINKTSTYNLSCNAPNNIIFSGTNATNISVYNDTPFTKNINLSHFGCTGTGICNLTYAKPSNMSVLVPCLGGGINYIKRHPSQEEVFALCDLGYKLRLKNGVYAYGADTTNNKSQGDVYTTYSSCTETCVAIGGHDTIMMDTIRPISLSFTGIVGNDVPNTSIVKRVELPDTTDGVLTITPTGFTFTPKPNFRFGEITIIYYPQCDTSAELGSATYITLLYPYPPLSPCVPDDDCNYICYGTFEESNNVLLWGNFNVYQSITPNTPDLYNSNGNVTCYRNNVEDFWHGCNEDDGGCLIEPGNLYPHITGGRQFVGLYLDIDPYSEGLYFKLKKPIYHNPSKRFRLKYLSRLRRNNCVDFKVIVAGDDTKPDTIPHSIFSYVGSTKICNKFCDTIGRDTIKNDTWNYYDIPIEQPKLGDSFTYIIVYGEPNKPIISEPGYILEYYALFDNFELYDSIDVKVLINSNPNNITPCQDTTHSIDYFVCLDKPVGLNSDSILIHVNLPTGFSIAAGSDFNSSGICKIPANTISNTICDTLKLNYTINYSILDYNVGYDIITGYNSPAYCKDEEANIVRIFPQNKAVTIQKTVSKLNPTIGDTITFNLQICNQSKDEITDIVLTDTIPAGLKILDYAGFSLVNNIITKDISIDSAIAGVATCNAYQYKCIVESDCKISNKVYLKSLTNVCFKANSTVMLNAASTGSAVYGFITPIKAIWCGNPLTLTANVVNPSGTYTYQWQYNSTNIAGATSSSYTATVNGIYGVNISQNGCSSQIISKSFDSSFTITKLIINPNCTASNGSITISPENGIKPYTYTWSGSTNTSNLRTGLIADTYIVTITDSIGCSKVDTIILTAILDTPKISKLVTNKICQHQGKISITPTYGKAPFHYIWNDLDTNSNRIGLNKGAYKVTITDSLGCKLVDSIVIDSSQNTILANDSIIDNYCTNNTNGKIYLSPSGGIKPYQYLWDNNTSDSFRTGLMNNSYYVTITDSFGCILKDTFVITTKSKTILFNDSIVDAYCINNTGKAFLRPYGGTEPYTFLWNNGSTQKDTFGLKTATYYLTATDVHGCKGIDTVYIGFVFSTKQIEDSIIKPYCSSINGEIHLKVTGTNPPFNYLWNNGSTDSLILGIDSGIYSVIVTDSIGCKDTSVYNIQPIINNITVLDSINHIYCSNLGSIYLKPNSTPSYFYIWDNGDTTLYRNNLSSGSYTVSIFDNLGCFNSKSITVLNIGNDLVVNDSIVEPTNCVLSNAKIYTKITGGLKPYTYNWSTGESTADIIGKSAGSFILTVTDASGCSVVKNFIINPPIKVRGYIRELINCTNNTSVLEFINLTDAPISSYYWKNMTNNVVLSYTNSASVANNNHNIKLSITEPNGCISYYFSTPNAANYITLGSNYGASMASLDQAIANGYTSNVDSIRKFIISGTFTIDENWDLTHSDIILDTGAVIKVGLYNNPIVNLSNNNIYTCLGQLAKGFEINKDNSEFNFTKNIIRDCYKAIEINSSILTSINNNKFYNNLIGIHMIGAYNNILNITNTDNFEGNVFQPNIITSLSYTVKPSYPSMTADWRSFHHFQIPSRTSMTRSWASMILENINDVTIGSIAKNKIEIRNSDNGIMHYGGNISLTNFSCANMIYNNSCNFMSGTGVYAAENPRLKTELTINGFGKFGDFNIQSAYAGLYVHGNITTKILNSRMIDVGQGVILNEKNNSVYASNLTASNCNIGANIIGFNLNNYYNNFKCNITNNQIIIGNNLGKGYLPTGIDLSNNNLGINNAQVNISNNLIGFTNKAEIGIAIQGFPKTIAKSSIRVTNNTILLDSLKYAEAGISYYNTYGNFEDNNTITGTNRSTINPTMSPRIYPVGINYEASEGTFKCNTINNLRTGSRFMGPCIGSDWTKNKLNNHTYGLRLETGTTLKDHDRAGNSFAGICDTEAISWQLIPTIFKYRNLNSIYLPNPRLSSNPSWWVYFPSLIESNECSSILIKSGFVSIFDIGPYVDHIQIRSNDQFYPMSRDNTPIDGVELNAVDTSILMNHIIFDLYEPELVWQQRQVLYDKLKPYEPQYPDTSIFRDYIMQIEDGTINEFTEITKLEKITVEEHQDDELLIESILTSIDSAWLDIHRLDSSYHETRDSVTQIAISAQRSSTYQYIQSQNTALTSLYTSQIVSDSVQVDAIVDINESITPEGRADSLRWEFNKVYYQTYGIGIVDIPEPKQNIYQSLAAHCPYENFDVVYRSRAITKIRNREIRYNDSILCANVGITLKATKPLVYDKRKSEPKITYSVFPNPAKDYINILISKIPKNTLNFIVTDIVGREIFNSNVELNSNNYSIDTKLWNTGVYHLRIISNNELLFHSQLLKLK